MLIPNSGYEVMKKDKMLSDDASDADVKFVGYSLTFHNTSLSIDKVMKKYFDKDIVVWSFRIMKEEVQLYPIRLWLHNCVKAHVKISTCPCVSYHRCNINVQASMYLLVRF